MSPADRRNQGFRARSSRLLAGSIARGRSGSPEIVLAPETDRHVRQVPRRYRLPAGDQLQASGLCLNDKEPRSRAGIIKGRRRQQQDGSPEHRKGPARHSGCRRPRRSLAGSSRPPGADALHSQRRLLRRHVGQVNAAFVIIGLAAVASVAFDHIGQPVPAPSRRAVTSNAAPESTWTTSARSAELPIHCAIATAGSSARDSKSSDSQAASDPYSCRCSRCEHAVV